MIISLNIPDEKVQGLIDALNGRHPVPMIPGSEIPEYSRTVWAKKVVIHFLRDELYLWEERNAIREARGNITKDENIVS